jgi:probable HAF family extracellular repeat protein
MVLIRALALLTIVSVGSVTSLAQDKSCGPARRYHVAALPLRPSAINESGEIVGTTPARVAAWWTTATGLREIPVPPGATNSSGIGLNNHGDIIGIGLNLQTSQRQGFAYLDGKLQTLSGSQAKPFGINDADEIAGESKLPGKPTSAPTRWKQQYAISLGGCCGGTATGINNHSQMIGNVYDEAGQYHAFLWGEASGMQRIGPPNTFSSAVAINDSGDVLVQSFSDGVLLYHQGKAQRLALSSKRPSHPKALNDCGVIVGAFGPFSDADRAFVWDVVEGFRDLNDLIPAKSGWKLETATAVNNRGQIVGWGEHGGEEDVGFLLTPEP